MQHVPSLHVQDHSGAGTALESLLDELSGTKAGVARPIECTSDVGALAVIEPGLQRLPELRGVGERYFHVVREDARRSRTRSVRPNDAETRYFESGVTTHAVTSGTTDG
jgi:hypothetical protein